ncbi:MAG: hypothetical protein OER90_17450 [Gemmatimonadota bacterium]|nr:hypothetical protein [Gemmatimonadota bacterium]
MIADIRRVANVLSAIAGSRGRRTERQPDDLKGTYDYWFDGGAYKVFTGWNEYDFADGTKAVVPTTPALIVEIRLPTGEYVTIGQQSSPPPNFQMCAVQPA